MLVSGGNISVLPGSQHFWVDDDFHFPPKKGRYLDSFLRVQPLQEGGVPERKTIFTPPFPSRRRLVQMETGHVEKSLPKGYSIWMHPRNLGFVFQVIYGLYHLQNHYLSPPFGRMFVTLSKHQRVANPRHSKLRHYKWYIYCQLGDHISPTT